MFVFEWVLCAALVVMMALLIALYRRVDEIPPRLLRLREVERKEAEAKAVTALKEATATRVTAIVQSLRSYDEAVAERYRTELAATETRASVAERRASDAAGALSTAVDLVRELRDTLDRFAPELRDARPGANAEEPDEPPDERTTVAPARSGAPVQAAPSCGDQRKEGSR